MTTMESLALSEEWMGRGMGEVGGSRRRGEGTKIGMQNLKKELRWSWYLFTARNLRQTELEANRTELIMRSRAGG